MKKRFEFHGDDSAKFWEIERKGAVVHVRYGRVGTDGRVSEKTTASPAEAKKHAEKQIASKLKKGYRPVGEGQPSAPAKKTAKTPTDDTAASEIAVAVDAWRAFADELKKNARFEVKSRFGKPIGERALARIRKAWARHTLPAPMVEFLRVVDGFDFEVREADREARVFLNELGQDPPEHHFWGSKRHAEGPPDLLFGDLEPRPFLVLDEPAPEWCYGFLMLGELAENPRVSYHAAAEESVETTDDLAGYLESSLAATRAAVTQAERLLIEREGGAQAPEPAPPAGRSEGLFVLADLSTHDLDGRGKERLKKSRDPATVQALEVQIKDANRPFDLALLHGFTALEQLTVAGAPQSIELSPLKSQKKLSELALWMGMTLSSDGQRCLPDLAEVELASVRTVRLWDVGRLPDWSALRAFPNAREVEVTLRDDSNEITSLDVWPEAERISISGVGEAVQLSSAARLPKKLQRLALNSLGLAEMPSPEGGAALLELDLEWNSIAGTIDWSTSLPELTTLDLRHNQIEAIAALRGLPKLTKLVLDDNLVAHLGGLEALTALQSLSMRKNRLTTIESLATLRDLETLDLADNEIPVIAGLDDLEKLRTLDLSGNPLTDLDGLAGVAEGCVVRLAKCGLSSKQKRAVKKQHGERLELDLG